MIIYMCYSLFAALFSKTFLSHPPFKYPRSAPDTVHAGNFFPKSNSCKLNLVHTEIYPFFSNKLPHKSHFCS